MSSFTVSIVCSRHERPCPHSRFAHQEERAGHSGVDEPDKERRKPPPLLRRGREPRTRQGAGRGNPTPAAAPIIPIPGPAWRPPPSSPPSQAAAPASPGSPLRLRLARLRPSPDPTPGGRASWSRLPAGVRPGDRQLVGLLLLTSHSSFPAALSALRRRRTAHPGRCGCARPAEGRSRLRPAPARTAATCFGPAGGVVTGAARRLHESRRKNPTAAPPTATSHGWRRANASTSRSTRSASAPVR